MMSHRGPGRYTSLATAFVTLVVVLIAVSGCDLGASSQTAAAAPTPLPTVTLAPTPLSSATPGVPLPAFNGSLGPVPVRCPASPPLQNYQTHDFGGGFFGDITFQGGNPVWTLGIGYDRTLKLSRDASSGYYDIKIMWVVGPNFDQPVTLSAHGVQGGAPLWFDIYPRNGVGNTQDVYGTSALLDPGAPNRGGTDNSTGHWNIWGVGLIALSAGCYDLTASWATGSWHTILAVGV